MMCFYRGIIYKTAHSDGNESNEYGGIENKSKIHYISAKTIDER